MIGGWRSHFMLPPKKYWCKENTHSVTMSALAAWTAMLRGSWPCSSTSVCDAPLFRNRHTWLWREKKTENWTQRQEDIIKNIYFYLCYTVRGQREKKILFKSLNACWIKSSKVKGLSLLPEPLSMWSEQISSGRLFLILFSVQCAHFCAAMH